MFDDDDDDDDDGEKFMISSFRRKTKTKENAHHYGNDDKVDDNNDDVLYGDDYDNKKYNKDEFLYEDGDQSQLSDSNNLEESACVCPKNDVKPLLDQHQHQLIQDYVEDDEFENEHDRENDEFDTDDEYEGDEDNIDMLDDGESITLEEEILLNSTMLESLSTKLLALDADIATERNNLKEYSSNIESLKERQNQLRATRETNMKLMKNVTSTINKCMQRLRKKLDKKTVMSCNYDENDVDEEDGNEVEVSNITHKIDDINNHSNTSNQTTGIPIEEEDQSQKINGKEEQKEAAIDTHESSRSIQQQEPPPQQKTPIQNIENDMRCMQQLWSQSFPSNCSLYRHSTAIKDPIFPLYLPISSPTLLQRMIRVSHNEINARRRKIIKEERGKELENDYREEIRETCLDIYACSQYDPFYLNNVIVDDEKCTGENNVKIPEKNSSNEEDKQDASYTNENVTEHSNDDDKEKVDPNTIICRYDLLGECNDLCCPYQHLSNSNPTTKRVMRRKGSNKIAIVQKKRDTSTTKNDPVITINLPKLNLPPLPDTFMFDLKLGMSIEASHDNSNHEDEEKEEDDDDLNGGNHENEKEEENNLIGGKISAEEESLIGKEIQRKRKRNDDDKATELTDEHYLSLCAEKRVITIQESPTAKSESLECDQNVDDKDVTVKKQRLQEQLVEQKEEDCQEEDYKEEDYITLPTINNNLSQDDSDTNEEETLEKSEEISLPGHEDQDDVSTSNDDINVKPIHLYNALNSFKFEVKSTHSASPENFEVIYKGSISIIDTNNHNDSMLDDNQSNYVSNTLNLLCNLIDATRLCVHSGRLDICKALMIIVEKSVQDKGEVNKHSPESESFMLDFDNLVGLIISDITKFSHGNFFGRGSMTYNNSFHTQLGLALIAHFLRSFRQAIMERGVPCLLKETERRLFIMRYKRFTSLALGMKYEATNDSDDDGFIFPSEILSSVQSTTNESQPRAIMFRVFESFFVGQKLANNLAKSMYCSNFFTDPQLILDHILHPLLTAMQSHVVLSKSSITKDAIDSVLKGAFTDGNSSGLPTQLCTFSTFGPAVFACFAGIFNLIKKEEQEDSNGNDNKGLTLRLQSIIFEARSVIMTLINQFDNSGIIGENYEGQLLLTPFFSLMANILITLGSYSKCQVLLENALYTGSSNTMIWSIYSEALWSQLMQLRICFPSHQLKTRSVSFIDNTATSIMIKDFSCRPLLYGLHIARVSLKGDSSLVHCCRSFSSTSLLGFGSNDTTFLKKKGNLLQWDIQKVCSYLILVNTQNQEEADSNEASSKSHVRIVVDPSWNIRGIPVCPSSLLLAGNAIMRLTLSRARLRELPLTFGTCLQNLKILDLSHNDLETFPTSIKELRHLTKLDINDNQFKNIPSFISCLEKLSVLTASDNDISDISPLCSCKELHTIDLRRNNVKHVPTELPLKLINLSRLLLDDNPLGMST